MKNALKRFWSGIGAAWRAAFGRLNWSFQWSWSPPSWLARILQALRGSRPYRALAEACRRVAANARANPARARKMGGACVAVAAVGVGAWQGYLYWKSKQPVPNYVRISFEVPSPTFDPALPKQPLIVEFSYSAARLDQLDKPVPEGVALSPKINGSWRWRNDHSLVFTPGEKGNGDADWRVGQHYDVRFDEKLFAEHVELEDDKLGFETPAFRIYFNSREFYVDPRDPRIKRVTATVSSNFPIEPEIFKKKAELSLRTKDAKVLKERGKSIPFTTSFDKHRTTAYLVSDPIAVPRDESVMSVKIAAGVTSSLGGPAADELKGEVDVPGLYGKLRIQGASVVFARNEKYEPEQALIVNTTSEMKSEDVAAALKAWVLPTDRPALGRSKVAKNYRWRSFSEMTPEIEKLSTPLKLELVPSGTENSMAHSFRFKADPKRFLALKIPKGLKGYGGYELAKDWAEVVAVPAYPKELQIMSQGALLSLGGDKKLPFLARNVREVEVEIARILPDRLSVLSTVAYRYYRSFYETPTFGMVGVDDLSERFEFSRKLQPAGPGSTEYFSVDLEPYLGKGGGGKRGLFYLQTREKKGRQFDSRLVLVTDLGMIEKQAVGGGHEIYVQNLRTGQPVAGASVEVVGRNGIAALAVQTDAEGRARFPDLADLKREKEPIAFVARREGDMSFLPYGMDSRRLEYSRFDVGGVHEAAGEDALSAFVFSDRGIYRPGESVNLGLIVRSKNWSKPVEDAPLVWTVTDPRGNSVLRESIRASSSELRSLSFATQDSSPTGTYTIEILTPRKRGGHESIGSATVRVEEFVPDKLRITTSLSEERREGWVRPGDKMKASVSLRNLFGTPAENRRVRASIALWPVFAPSFKAFPDYRFADVNSPKDRSVEEQLGEIKTEKDGAASFEIDLSRFSAKLFQLRFDAEGFDANGGRGVRASSSTLASTLPFMVGTKADGDLEYVKKGSKRLVRAIAVSPELKKIAANDLELVLIEKRYVSSLMEQPNGTYKYQSSLKETPGPARRISIPEAGYLYEIPSDKPGDFAVAIRQPGEGGLELAKFSFSIVGEGNLSRSLERSAELQVALNKKDFAPGEEIEMQIKAPYAGAGLITIERDKVFASKWFKSPSSASIERIRIPEGVEGGAYVNVAFLRAIDSKEIFMSPLSYAVQPFSISLDRRRTAIKLEAPDLVRPGQRLTVSYSADRPTDMVVYGVDEGILQIARYQTPDPLGFFFKRRALQVRTFQLLDLLLPEFSVVQSLSAPGGDQSDALGKNLNPFKRKAQKPVAFWSGTVKADQTKKTYSYAVPDWFNGSIKVMAVAASASSLGAGDRKALSRGDFIVTPNAPSFAAPGDEFELGVGVSNQLEGSGPSASLTVRVGASDAFEIIGPAEKPAQIPEGRESEATFRLRAKRKLGPAKLEVMVASSGGKAGSAKASAEVSVRPAIPYETSLVAGDSESLPFEVAVPRTLLPEFRKQTFAVSPLPLATGHALVSYLDDYPYGCTEQLLSKAVPAIFLRMRPEFGIPPEKAAQSYKVAIATLRSRQAADGGFALYSPSGGSHVPATLYAVNVMLDAADRGLAPPDDVLARALDFLRTGAARRTENLALARQFAQSLYLQARSGTTVPSNDLGFLRKALETNFSGKWENDAAAAYMAAAYKLLKQDDEAARLIRKVSLGAPTERDYESFYDPFVRDAILVYLAGRHFPERAKELAAPKALRELARPIARGDYNSQSAARAIMAFDSVLGTAETSGALKDVRAEEIFAAQGAPAKQLVLSGGAVAKAALSPGVAKVRASGSSPMALFYAVTQSGFDAELPKSDVKSGLELQRAYLDKNGVEAKEAKLGEELSVRLRARAAEKPQIENVVLVDLLPGGFEVVLDSRAANEGGSGAGPAIESEGSAGESGEGEVQGDEGEGGDARLLQKGLDERLHARFDPVKAFFRSLPRAWAQASSLAAFSANYVDYREDRVVVYGWASRSAREFVYKIKAVSAGTFVVPPAFGEAMYDRGVRFRGTASKIIVKP